VKLGRNREDCVTSAGQHLCHCEIGTINHKPTGLL